jgi:DNA-binding transcriptional LysR family regulator
LDLTGHLRRKTEFQDLVGGEFSSSQIEFRHLRCFLAVAETLSFNRAAARLGISQQQVSQTVLNLESMVGARLFERTTRSVSLTEAGATLLVRTHELFDDFERAITETQLSASGRTGRLILGIAGGTAESRLPRVFSNFRKQFPSIYLDIRLQSSGAQIEALVRGEIDAGFAISPLPRDGICVGTLCRAGFVLQAPSSLETRHHRSLHDFREHPFIALATSVSPGYAARCQMLFEEAGFTPRIVQHADNRQTIMTLVSAGVGVSVAPALIQGSQRIGVKHIPLDSDVEVELVLATRCGDDKKALSSLRELAKSVFAAGNAASPE